MNKVKKRSLETFQIPTPIKLSLLWASLMSLYIYNDYFVLFMPGTIDMMSAGVMGPFGEVTDLKMIAVAVVLAIPASMVFLSSTLPSGISRRLNIVLGLIYAIIAVLTLFGSPAFYKLIVSIEIACTLLIVWFAARWPKQVMVE